MLSKEIQGILDKIEAKSGVNAKQEQLRLYINDPEVKEVLRFALSPYITFGIGKKTMEQCLADSIFLGSEGNFTTETWELLEQLANRDLTGNEAKEAIKEELSSLNNQSIELLTRIITKDLKCGLKTSSVNKVSKGLIPEYKVALAHPMKKYAAKMTYPAAVEMKLDGMRLITEVQLGDMPDQTKVAFKSREGHELHFDNLVPSVIDAAWLLYEAMGRPINMSGIMLDGEVEAGESFKTSMQILKKGGGDARGVRYTLFWCQPLELFLKQAPYDRNYQQQRALMKKALGAKPVVVEDSEGLVSQVSLVDSYIVSSEAEAAQLYQNARANNLEGVIVKKMDAKYDYKRTNTWLKVKANETLDLTIVDIEEGEGRLENNCGKIVVEYKGKRVGVGSGLSDEMRQAIWDDPDAFIDEIAEISFQEITEAGSLRHPVFEGIRKDKSTSDSEKKD